MPHETHDLANQILNLLIQSDEGFSAEASDAKLAEVRRLIAGNRPVMAVVTAMVLYNAYDRFSEEYARKFNHTLLGILLTT